MRAGQRKPGAVVVEVRIQPCGCAVARVAGLGEIPRYVVRVGRALVILQVASHTRGAVQAVVVIDVAVGALPRRYGVHAGEGEAGGRVIELAIRPGNGVVTVRARSGEPGVWHWRGRVGVVGLVATDAGRIGEIVVVVDMAVGTLPRRNGVGTGQGKS